MTTKEKWALTAAGVEECAVLHSIAGAIKNDLISYRSTQYVKGAMAALPKLKSLLMEEVLDEDRTDIVVVAAAFMPDLLAEWGDTVETRRKLGFKVSRFICFGEVPRPSKSALEVIQHASQNLFRFVDDTIGGEGMSNKPDSLPFMIKNGIQRASSFQEVEGWAVALYSYFLDFEEEPIPSFTDTIFEIVEEANKRR